MPLSRVGTLLLVAFIATLPPAFFARTQIVINEIMQNPEFAGDTEGEWLELFNIGGTEIDLGGWTIRDDGSNSHVISPESSLIIPPGAFLVLGRNADTLINGNVHVAYAYGSAITLGNGSDQVILEDGDGVEQDRVEYDDGLTFPDPTGASMELIHPSVDNNLGKFWIEAQTSWGGNDQGTPGFANSVLDEDPPLVISVVASGPLLVEVLFNEEIDPITGQTPANYLIDPDVGTPLNAQLDSLNPAKVLLTVDQILPGVTYTLSVTGVTDIVGNLVVPSVHPFSLAEPLSEGDIVVTEIMNDPSAVSDSEGEWFEIYNTTNSAINVGGWFITDGGSNSFTVQGTFLIPSRSFGIFCVNADSSSNGGFHFPFMYDWGSSGTFTLGNTDDKIILKSNGQIIDSVSYDGGTQWPDPTGASMGLADFSTDNNTGGNWTAALSRQPAYSGNTGDLGSPGTLGDNQSVGAGPIIVVDPDSVEVVLGPNEGIGRQIHVANAGSELLTWSVLLDGSPLECAGLVVTPAGGEVSPGDTDTLNVRFSSDGLTAATYPCVIRVESNDESMPVVTVPALLEVVDTVVSGSISVPDEMLPVPAEGDTVTMDIELVNPTSRGRQVEVWLTLLRPGEQEPRQILEVSSIRLAPRSTTAKSRTRYIPAHSNPGTYALTMHIGSYPDSVFYSSTFMFEKEGVDGVRRLDFNVSGVPARPFLDQSYPSPFNASTTILYGLSEDTWVTLKVYDMLGREVTTLVNELQFAGYKSVSWNGRNNEGNLCSSGSYIYRITAGSYADIKTTVYVK